MLSDLAKKQILANLYTEEDYRQFAYDDASGNEVRAPKGYLTIGIGWNIQINGCPREIAEYAAMYFINKADKDLSKKIPLYDGLDDVRKAVLCDMAFNMGVGGVLEFHNMLLAIKNKDYRSAAIAMLNSNWAKQVSKNRSMKLFAMMETGEWH